MTLKNVRLSATVVAAAFSVSLPALAFFPPQDSRDGVSAYFVGFDEETPADAKFVPQDRKVILAARRDAAKPFEIRLDVANDTSAIVSGELRIWLNDDWDVAVPGGDSASASFKRSLEPASQSGASVVSCLSSAVAIPPLSTNSFFATAIPKPDRVIPSLYPIHATFAIPGGEPLHPIAIFEPVLPEPSASLRAHDSSERDFPRSALPIRLAALAGRTFTQMPGAEPKPIEEESRETGAFFNTGWQCGGGDMRYGFFSQPPWRSGGGAIWRDFPVELPATKGLALHLSAAIRSALRAGEGRGDGAEYKVFVVERDGRTTEIYSALVKSRSWVDGVADLAPWAGQAVTLRLWNGCGPANDPNYDRCLWGDVGVFDTAPEAANQLPAAEPVSFPLAVRGEAWTASFTPGAAGLIDGSISFSDGERTLSFAGFNCAIDDIMVGPGPVDARCTAFEIEPPGDDGALAVRHDIDLRDGRKLVARATLRADGPALRVGWDMPGTEREPNGSPRFTRLGIGAASEPAARVCMSFGNVLEEPRSFELAGGLFRNHASHAGAEYPCGVSICQAADSVPDRVVCRRDSNVFAVETCHDATLSFVPSSRGAFAAARAWRDVSGHSRSPSWREAATRMCIDQWGGLANKKITTAAALEKIAKYGVTNLVYVRHVWQRWTFDYRLPEIWPPSAKYFYRPGEFMDMVAAAKRNGILFLLHDNYIDCYPDAAGFSYDNVAFDETGAPIKAWFNFNRDKRAQSYRWATGAFMPALRQNAVTLRDAIAPDGFFIDVWSNMAPYDWYDRAGRFHDRTETRAAWAEAVNEYRRVLGGKGVAVGEGGHDALVGAFDAGQPDHLTPARWMDRGAYADSERIPWHDIVTHGRYVLYGGGLGWRYASDSSARGGDRAKGSSSDSYICTTMIGGRSPLHDVDPKILDFRCVDTWWLVGDTSQALALSDFESFDFCGSIHKQHSVFAGGEGGGGQVWVNREREPWTVAGATLPENGFYAETATSCAGIVLIAGRRCAFSESGTALYVDGRPDRDDGTGPADVENAQALADFAGLGIKTDGAFRLQREDGALVLTPVPGSVPFRAEIDLARLSSTAIGAPDSETVVSVETVEPAGDAATVKWHQTGTTVTVSLDAKAFAYRLRF